MNINLLVIPLQIIKMKLNFLKKSSNTPLERRGAKKYRNYEKKELKILAECQKVIHPNKISHHIMVTVVKKPRKAKSLKLMNKSII